MYTPKVDILFYRKLHELPHGSGILHLDDKVSPMFRTHKNGVKNSTLTQWIITTNLCLVLIWLEVVIIMNSYPETTRDTPVNMVWVDYHKTAITSQMKTKYLRPGTLYFGEYRMVFCTNNL